MIRIVNQGRKIYGIEIKSLEDDLENIKAFIENAEAVIIVDTLEDLSQFSIDKDDVEMIDPD